MSRNEILAQLSWPEIPLSGPVILIADAMLQYIEQSWHTWYCILVRPVQGEDAVILPPFCRKGTETAEGWHEAFARLPLDLLSRVQALVSDGHTGLILEARYRDWFIQRCHFHLLARLQQKRSRFARGFHQDEGKHIYEWIMKALYTPSHTMLRLSLVHLARMSAATKSRDVRRMLRGFLTNYEDYRTYLRHPELHLPTTSNTAEACVGLMRELCRRARGFRTIHSMDSWIEALVKMRKTIKCCGNTNRII